MLPRRLEGIPRALWRVVIYPAIEGQMIMFPAWLTHGVEINESKEKGEKGWLKLKWKNGMIQTIYKELPFEKIAYLERAEFINGQEQSFHDALKASMSKYGFKDPVYCWYNSKAYGNKIKIIVGNNRMVIAKELNI